MRERKLIRREKRRNISKTWNRYLGNREREKETNKWKTIFKKKHKKVQTWHKWIIKRVNWNQWQRKELKNATKTWVDEPTLLKLMKYEKKTWTKKKRTEITKHFTKLSNLQKQWFKRILNDKWLYIDTIYDITTLYKWITIGNTKANDSYLGFFWLEGKTQNENKIKRILSKEKDITKTEWNFIKYKKTSVSQENNLIINADIDKLSFNLLGLLTILPYLYKEKRGWDNAGENYQKNDQDLNKLIKKWIKTKTEIRLSSIIKEYIERKNFLQIHIQSCDWNENTQEITTRYWEKDFNSLGDLFKDEDKKNIEKFNNIIEEPKESTLKKNLNSEPIQTGNSIIITTRIKT